MKKKKVVICILMSLIGLLQITKVNADEISDFAHESPLRQESAMVNRSAQMPSDIVTTEVVGGNSIAKPKASKKNTHIDDADEVNNTVQSGDAIGEILIQAISLMGISYKWGGNTPETGMDCSGFIRYVFKKSMGITLPRTADGMSKVGKRISIDDIQPGDLMFFNTIGGRRNTHMGMYIGNNQFIQSPHTGAKIQITNYNDYWRSHTNGVKRIVQEDADTINQTEDVQTFEDVRDEALPSGYIRGKHVRKVRHGRRHAGYVKSSRKTRYSKTYKPVKATKKPLKKKDIIKTKRKTRKKG